MLRLQLVTTPEDRKERELESEGDLLHGTAVLSRLVSPWAGSGRIASARLRPEICWRCEDCDKALPEGIS
jgi:hypothetical protein